MYAVRPHQRDQLTEGVVRETRGGFVSRCRETLLADQKQIAFIHRDLGFEVSSWQKKGHRWGIMSGLGNVMGRLKLGAYDEFCEVPE